MLTLAWTLGAVVLVGGAVTPLLLTGRRDRRRALRRARDTAMSQISLLQRSLDETEQPGDSQAVLTATRCLTLAGSALAGDDESAADYRHAADWAGRGLAALGVTL